jgi:hypothetical protein
MEMFLPFFLTELNSIERMKYNRNILHKSGVDIVITLASIINKKIIQFQRKI